MQGTGVFEENHGPVASHCQLYLIKMYRVHLTATLVVIGIDCIGRCKSNFQAMTITTTSGELRYDNNISIISHAATEAVPWELLWVAVHSVLLVSIYSISYTSSLC